MIQYSIIHYLLKISTLSGHHILQPTIKIINGTAFLLPADFLNLPDSVFLQISHRFWVRVSIDSRFEVTPEVIVQWVQIGAIWGPLKAKVIRNELVFSKLASQPFNRDLTAVRWCPILLKNRIFVNPSPLQSWDDLLFDIFYLIVGFYGLSLTIVILKKRRGQSDRFLSAMTLRDHPAKRSF